jgi:hypothetical protein
VEIAYAAHTESCTLMLDADGVCRWVVASNGGEPRSGKSQQAAARCIGAQYIASLDFDAPGGLVEMPRPGLPMLFARTDPDTGRIYVVRTGPIVRFEKKVADARPEGTASEPNLSVNDSETRERPAGPPHVPSKPKPTPTPAPREEVFDEDEWESETHEMARNELPVPDESGDWGEDWDSDIDTARVEVPPGALARMRDRSDSSAPTYRALTLPLPPPPPVTPPPRRSPSFEDRSARPQAPIPGWAERGRPVLRRVR